MKKMLFAINVDWYFNLHWKERFLSDMTSGYDLSLCLSVTEETHRWNGFNFYRLNLSRSSIGVWSNVKTFTNSIRIFKTVKPDAIHSVTVKPNIMFGLLALFHFKPILITIPGLGSIFSAIGLKPKIVRLLLLLIYWMISKNRNAFFVFENTSDLTLFKRFKICNDSNAITVPGAGVDINLFKPTPLQWGEDGDLQILFAARLLKDKGLYELVEVVSCLKQEGFPVSLNVAGLIDNDSRETIPLRQVETWHEERKLNWLGQIDNMQEVIAQNHVVVLPTRYGEGLPRILLEANACGRPVIATDIPGCNDFIKDGVNGFLVKPDDNHALKHAIKNIRNKSLCEELGRRGRNIVEKSYTKKHVIENYKKIYRQIFEG